MVNTISHFFGFPRCGKTTFIAYTVHKESKKGKYKRIYTNFPIDGAYRIDWEQFGKYDFSDSLILIDESSLFCDNRDYKNFSHEKILAIMMHGHFRSDIMFFSQDPKGIDRKIEVCVEKKFFIRRVGSFSFIIPVPKIIDFDESKDVVMGFKRPGFFQVLFCKKIFRPFYYKLFDSYEKPKLPPLPVVKW